jgi:hypothetical protein
MFDRQILSYGEAYGTTYTRAVNERAVLFVEPIRGTKVNEILKILNCRLFLLRQVANIFSIVGDTVIL